MTRSVGTRKRWRSRRHASISVRTATYIAVLAVPASPAAVPAQSNTEPEVAKALAELHELVNERRIAAGCPPLRWHEATAAVAEAHSADMARRDYFDHLTPEGTDLVERLLAGGVTWRGAIAENLALTVRGPETVIELWMDSPPHRENLLDCSFTHHGLGLFRDRWTQVLVEHPID